VEKIGAWQVGADGPVPLKGTSIELERHLEDWILGAAHWHGGCRVAVDGEVACDHLGQRVVSDSVTWEDLSGSERREHLVAGDRPGRA
jgi:hypothetical protein